MPDAFAVAAAVLPAVPATVALAAGTGQQRYHPISRLYPAYAIAHLLDYAGDLVAQNHAGSDSPAQDPGHDQPVVVAEPAGGHMEQGLAGFGARHGQVCHR